jgi:hypothetical protein
MGIARSAMMSGLPGNGGSTMARNYSQRIRSIIRQHNPEHDCDPGGPMVTWAEADLAHAVLDLIERVEELERQLLVKEGYDGAEG